MSALALRPAPAPDEDRFEDLFRGYYSRARGLARRRFPELDAEEIAQEAMLRVLTHVERIDGRRDPWPYIATITMNVGRDLVRSARPSTLELQEGTDAPLAPAADEELLQAELDDNVRSVLGQLTPSGRQVLTLHAYGDMSIGQIAAFLGCNDNAVRQKLFRARQQFVRVMEEVLAASAAVLGLFGWLLRRPVARRSGRVVVPASAMTLSGAVFAVLGVATLHLVSPFGSQAALATRSAALTTTAPVASPAHASAAMRHLEGTGLRPVSAPTAVVAATGPAQVSVAAPGSLFKKGQTNREQIVVHTPAGDLRLDNTGSNDPAEGNLCKTHVITCE
ncbi:MAG: hypothetical protein JWP11_3101 [Frankiales bacterium]|nr:hypothetical protein [Frankiales bacterium]